MTPTNNQIHNALYAMLTSANLGYPIIPNFTGGTPPSAGVWLQTAHFPNEPIDNGLAYDSGFIPRGIFQVECFGRKDTGVNVIAAAVEQVHDIYPKGASVIDRVRVVKRPYDMELEIEPDRIMVVVTIEYSG